MVVDPDIYFNGSYSKSYFDFPRNFTASSTTQLNQAENQSMHAQVMSAQQRTNPFSSSLRTFLRNWLTPAMDVPNGPEIINPPPDNPESSFENHEVTGPSDDCYIRSCYLTLNGKMMNSIPRSSSVITA